MAEKLANPHTATIAGTKVELGHVAFTFHDDIDAHGCVRCTRVLGNVNGDGEFVPASAIAQDHYANIQGKQLEKLLAANDDGKKEGSYRRDDLLEYGKRVLRVNDPIGDDKY